MCQCAFLSCATPAPPLRSGWRRGAYTVLFGSKILSKLSIALNILFIFLIVSSIVVVLVDSLQSVKETVGHTMNYVELCFSILFTLEYVVRLLCVRQCWRYMLSFMGIIDFLSAVPALFSLLYAPLGTLVLLRILKVSRIFRLFKLVAIFRAYSALLVNVERNLLKMVVFVIGFWSVCIVLGGFMHLLELENPSFDNMFKAIYWAVVTLTTVGYGDSVPESSGGQVLAAITMTLGYTFVVLGLRNQLPDMLPTNRADTDSSADDNTDNGSAHSPYVTLGSEVALSDEGGVEMQEQLIEPEHVIAVDSSKKPAKMLSFHDDDEDGSFSRSLVEPPPGAEYIHRDDEDDNVDESKMGDAEDDGEVPAYRRTYDHSL